MNKHTDYILLAINDGAAIFLACEPAENGDVLYECHKSGETYGFIDTTPRKAAKQYCEDNKL